jgi:hypothetical protein
MLPQPVVVPGDRRGQRRVHGAVEERELFGHISAVGLPVPLGDDRVSVAVDELGDVDAVVPVIVLARFRG